MMSHEFDHHHPQVRFGSRIKLVDRLCRRRDRGIVAKGDVRFDEVVVDGLGQADDVEAAAGESVGHFMRTVAAQANKAIEPQPIVGFYRLRGHVNGLAVGQRHLVRLFPAGTQDGAAQGKNSGDIVLVKYSRMILHQAAKALLDADDLDMKIAHRGLGHPTDRRVESWTIAATGQDPDATRLRGRHIEQLPRIRSISAILQKPLPYLFLSASLRRNASNSRRSMRPSWLVSISSKRLRKRVPFSSSLVRRPSASLSSASKSTAAPGPNPRKGPFF